MQLLSRQFTALSQTQLGRIATQVAGQLRAGDAVLLYGQIGAGKSVFARHMISALCPHELEIPSPTFTLIQTYEAPDFTLHHCDLYRLNAPEQCHELGLDDAFEYDVCVIEWPEIIEHLVPKDALHIHITVTGDALRDVDMHSKHPRWADVIGGPDGA